MAKKHRSKSKSIYILIGIVLAVGIFTIVTLSSASDLEILGVKTSYNIGRVFNLFEGSELSIAPSSVIRCYSGISMYGYTETGAKKLLSTTSTPYSYAYANFDITTAGGTKLKSVEISPFIYCDAISSTYYPNLIGGSVHVDWYGTKLDGTKVNMISNTDFNIQGSRDIAGKVYYFGSVSLTKDAIESKLGVGGLNSLAGTQNFKSLQSVSFKGKINFYQGTVTQKTWYYDVAGITTYSLNIQPVNPIATAGGQSMTLKVDSPADYKVNLDGYRVVTVTGTLDKWTADEGLPTLKLFFTDPTALASEKTTPLFVKSLSPTTSSSSESKFTSGYAFSKTAKHGEYTFEFSANKRIAVAKATVYVTVAPVQTAPAPSGGTTGGTNPSSNCIAPLVETTDGNCIDPNQQQNQNPPPEQICQGVDITSCLPPLPNFGELLQKNIGYIIILIVFIIVILIAKSAFSGRSKGITISQ